MVIDPHVHLRDFNETEKETVKHGLEVARDSGVSAVFDMPNTNPPITHRSNVTDRLALAKNANVKKVFYGLYLGLTSNPEQIKEAVSLYREFFPQIVGMKLYAGHSVGNLGVIDLFNQHIVYKTLAKEGFDGVLTVHAEKESELQKVWNPKLPISHCLARPEKAEVESVKDQLYLSELTGFKGKLHIAHISSPKAVQLVNEAQAKGRDISSGVCPHHLIYDWNKMFDENGVIWKMNPPLRAPGDPQIMLQYLREGKIDWLETDHAPHTLKQKTSSPFSSGITGLQHWQLFIKYLTENEFSEQRIEEVTFTKAANRFGIDIAKNKSQLKDRTRDYPFNFYSELEKRLA